MINPTYIYSTASNVAAFVNGYHIEQAYGFNFKESVPKIAIYGYNDYKFTKAVTGKGIVQGILVVNFMFPGYLNAIISQTKGAYVPKLYNYDINTGASIEEQHQDNIFNKLKTEMPPNTPETRAARAEYIVNLISKDAKKVSDSMRNAIMKSMQEDIPDTVASTISSPLDVKAGSDKGCRIEIYYQDPDFINWYVTFENVYFTEVSQSANQAGAEGSSEPLYEIYQFIASERKIKLLK